MKTTNKILLIDDEPDILEFISYNFRKKNFTVITAKNGLEGLKQADLELPQVIISDILMPEMNGIEMSMELRKNKKLNKTPIIFLTAAFNSYSFLDAKSSAADQYVAKPIKFENLLKIVNQVMNINQNLIRC